MKTAAILFLLAIAAIASFSAWQEHRQLDALGFQLRRLALVQDENARLHDALADATRKVQAAEDVTRRAGIEKSIAQIRGLPFREPVVYDVLTREGIREVISHKLSDAYSDREIEDMAAGYSAFGLLPPNFPLKQTYVDLLGEQVAAFYDQHRHRLFMFQDASLENSQNRVILAHELTHALQDQNFGLLKLPLEEKNDDDRAAAASALVEGDATLAMSLYMAQDLSVKTFTDSVGMAATQSMVQMRKAPRYLREMLLFPYLKGEAFCNALFARGGFPAISAAFANPPASTAQILHPEEYFAETREDPVRIAIPDTSFDGAKPLQDNVLGEMGARIFFEEALDDGSAEQAANGWRGDRYLVFQNGAELVWKTAWSTPAAAQAAFDAMEKVARARFKPFAKVLRGSANEVVFIHAPTEESANRLAEKFAGPSHG